MDPTDPDVIPGQVESTYDPAAVDAVLDHAQHVLSAVAPVGQQAVADLMAPAKAVATNVVGAVTGAVESLLGAAEKTAAKVENKSLSATQSYIDTAYYNAAQMGIPVPSPDQVIYGLQTGDYLGSVGLAAPSSIVPDPNNSTFNDSLPYDPSTPDTGVGGSGPDIATTAATTATPATTTPAAAGNPSSGVWPNPLTGAPWQAVCPTGSPTSANLYKVTSPAYDVNPHDGVTVVTGSGPVADVGGMTPDGVAWIPYSIPLGDGSQRNYYAPPHASIVTFVFPMANVGKVGWALGCPGPGMCYWAMDPALNCGGTPPSPPPPPTPPPPPNPAPPTPPPPTPPAPPPPTGPMPTSCPVPAPKAGCAPIPSWKPAFSTEDPCNMVATISAGAGPGKDFLNSVLTWAYSGVEQTGIVGQIQQLLTGTKDSFVGGLLQGFKSAVTDCLKFVTGAVTPAGGNDLLGQTAYLACGYNFFNKWAGVEIPQWGEELRQRFGVAEQYKIPDGPTATALWLNDSISEAQWRCFQQLDGQVIEWQDRIRKNMRTQLDPHQLTESYRRGLTTRDDWVRGMRGLGVINDADRDRMLTLQYSQPGLGDVISFMVRDVGDAALVAKFDMDFDFQNKWNGELKTMGEQLGVTDKLAQYFWRAHWHLPSPTQLYNMLHRNRPGRVAPGEEVTSDDVRTALQQDDVLPWWVPRLMATSYLALDKAGAKAGYKAGVLTADDLLEVYQDQGYNLRDATLIRDTVVAQIRKGKKADVGGLTRNAWQKAYADRVIDDATLKQELYDLSADDDLVTLQFNAAVKMRALQDRRRLIAAVKRRFTKGLISNQQAVMMLNAGGVTGEQQAALMSDWEQVIKITGKELSSGQLCKMAGQNLVSQSAHRDGLVSLGYSATQANLIASSCERDITDKAVKAAQAAAAKQAADSEKARKKAISDWDRENKNRKIEGLDPLPYPDLP